MTLTPEQKIVRLRALAAAGLMSTTELERQIALIRGQADTQASRPASSQPSDRSFRDRALDSQWKAKSKRIAIDQAYVLAPYRFVGLEDVAVMPEREIGAALSRDDLFSNPLADGFTGRIALEWEAETPLLIGDDVQQPPSAVRGDKKVSAVTGPLRAGADSNEFWVPGATLRGMVRAACETVGYARLGTVNDHHIYGFRDFSHPRYSSSSDSEAPISKAEKICAGWLSQTEKQDEKTGLPIHKIELWGNEALGYIDIMDLLNSHVTKRGINDVDWRENHDLEQRYAAIGQRLKDATGKGFFERKITFKGIARPQFAGDKRRFHLPMAEDGVRTGYLVFSNKSPRGSSRNARSRKKVEYVFLEPDQRPEPVELTPEEFQAFWLVNTAPGRKKREAEGSFAFFEPLLAKGERIPVFYVGLPQNARAPTQDVGQFAFGLTRTFKLPHLYGIADKLNATTAHRRSDDVRRCPDMTEALFGYVREGVQRDGELAEVALKGRFAFSGGRILETASQRPVVSEIIETVMMAPKPSFSPFYLEGRLKDWSVADSHLAGRKRYLPRTTTGELPAALQATRARLQQQVKALPPEAQSNPKVKTRLQVLHGNGQPLGFRSFVDVHNITAAELGLLLFALTFGESKAGEGTRRHMIGRGRAFGMGQLRLAAVSQDGLEAHGPEGAALLSAPNWIELLIACFTKSMRAARDEQRTEGPHSDRLARFPDCQAVREWLDTCDPAKGAALADPAKDQPRSLKVPNPRQDNYLRLKYSEPNEKTGEMGSQNPYVKLRRATMPLKDDDAISVSDHPRRLLKP